MGPGHQGGWTVRRLRSAVRTGEFARGEKHRIIAGDVTHRHLILVDSITEVAGQAAGAVIVCGSHGGVSSGRYALRAMPRVVVFNDAGVGLDNAGIRALQMLQDAGLAACAVAHSSARIGDAQSTLESGLISHLNAAAQALGGCSGLSCRDWVDRLLDSEA